MTSRGAKPFMSEFQAPLLSGRKTATTRPQKWGEPGDTFDAFGVRFELLTVTRLPLWIVAEKFYREEGFEEPDGFVNAWLKVHNSYKADRIVYLHRFEIANGGSDQ
jgi:hypothetical protein